MMVPSIFLCPFISRQEYPTIDIAISLIIFISGVAADFVISIFCISIVISVVTTSCYFRRNKVRETNHAVTLEK